MPSKQAEMIHKIMKVLKIKEKNKFETPKRKLQRDDPPARMRKRFDVDEIKILGQTVAIMSAKEKEPSSPMHIIYLHGGAYTMDALPPHWIFMKKILERLDCRLSFLDYPLAPESTYRETFAMVSESYTYLTKRYPDDEFILMGDSAGGGLALAFLQFLKINNKQMPAKTVCFSPWLDLSMQNPFNKILEEVDLDLTKESLIEAGLLYAGGDDVHQYQLSPINGPLDGLGEVIVFYGTHEIFYADCEKLKQLAAHASSDFKFFSYDEMQHVFILFPIPEAQDAFEKMVSLLQNESSDPVGSFLNVSTEAAGDR